MRAFRPGRKILNLAKVKPEFQIIGGGIIGLSTAYALLKQGVSVRIIEAREAVALETSFANAGMVHASLADPWNGPRVGRQMLGSLIGLPSPMLLRLKALPNMTGWGLKFLKHSTPARHWQATQTNYKLAKYSADLIHSWRDALNVQDDSYGMGLLKIFRRQAALDKAAIITDKLRPLGLRAKYLSGVAAAQKEPCLAPIADKLVGAIYYPEDFKADAYAFCRALEQAVIKLGGEILTNTKVLSLRVQNGRITGVRTPGTDLQARTTIIAAGAQSTNLLRPLGMRLPVRPVKGYSLTFENTGAFEDVDKPKLPVVDDDQHCAITPFGQSVRIAGTAEITGFDASLSQLQLKPLLTMLHDVYPDLAQSLNLEDGKAWQGFRPVSADGVPFIGVAKPGLAVNTGHGHMGWTMSAGSGALLADILLGEKASMNTCALSPNRTI